MITVLKNRKEYVYGLIEWYLVDVKGQLDDVGKYMYINELWIHPDKRRKTTLKHLIQKLNFDPNSYTAKFVYWRNRKFKRLTPSYPRDRLAKIGEKK